jgi:Ni/Fe-hydrogenase 1 B-type cytochrome subunit
MVVLAFTGFYIHYPFFAADMALMRQLHFIFMYVVLIALVWRIWFAFFGQTAVVKGSRTALKRDIHNFIPQEENRHQLIETVKYYLFLRKTHPISGKYNPLQKLAYVALAGLLVVQAYSGFALYGPVQNSVLWPFFGFGVDLVGGSLMYMRMFHFLVMWLFILITMIHVYLSVAEDIASVPLMFFYKETPAD